MCRLPSPSRDHPISSSFRRKLRRCGRVALQFLPAKVNTIRVVGRRAGRSAPAASRTAPPPRAPAPARPRARPAGPPARTPTNCAAGPSAPAVPNPANGSPGGGRFAPRHAGFLAATPAIRSSSAAISGTPSMAAACNLPPSVRERCDSTSKRRMDSTWSPNRSMRTGLRSLGRKYVQDSAAQRVLAHHLHRLAPLVADAFQVRNHLIQRQFVAHLQLERKLPVEIAGLDPQQRRGHRQNRDRHPLRCQAPQSNGPLLQQISACGERFCSGRTSRAGRSCGPVRASATSRS